MTVQRVAIIGGGIGGLATALAVQSCSELELSIIERDPAPPELAPEQAFDAWERPGVPQFRHAHILLARVQTTLRDQHPALLQQLFDAGMYLSTVEEILPPSHYHGVRPQPDDADLLHLWGRRATFEYVLRRYVGTLPNVRFIHDTKVIGYVTTSDTTQLVVKGVEVARGDGTRETIAADVVVDASGARSKTFEWLEAQGVKIGVEAHPSGFVYACRHYRLTDPASAPARELGGGNFDYLGYATFYAEHGHYALTFGCPDEEAELSALIRKPEGFEALCAQLPVLKHWTNRSVPTTKVLGAGRFENRWRTYGAPGGRALLGLFAVGDSQLLTNPMYGRGCASAFVQAGVLAEVLRELSDPRDRAKRYQARSRELLQPYFNLSVSTDRMYRTRAKLRRGAAITWPDKLLNYAYEKAWLPATYRYPLLAREFLKSVQMREVSSLAVRLVSIWFLFAGWAQTWFKAQRLPSVAPPRDEFLRRVTRVSDSK